MKLEDCGCTTDALGFVRERCMKHGGDCAHCVGSPKTEHGHVETCAQLEIDRLRAENERLKQGIRDCPLEKVMAENAESKAADLRYRSVIHQQEKDMAALLAENAALKKKRELGDPAARDLAEEVWKLDGQIIDLKEENAKLRNLYERTCCYRAHVQPCTAVDDENR